MSQHRIMVIQDWLTTHLMVSISSWLYLVLLLTLFMHLILNNSEINAILHIEVMIQY